MRMGLSSKGALGELKTYDGRDWIGMSMDHRDLLGMIYLAVFSRRCVLLVFRCPKRIMRRGKIAPKKSM